MSACFYNVDTFIFKYTNIFFDIFINYEGDLIKTVLYTQVYKRNWNYIFLKTHFPQNVM